MPSAGPKRPLSEPMSRWERSKTRWSDSGTGRNGRERLESGIWTTENTESTERGGDEHGDERALGAGGGGSPAGPGGRLARAGRRPSKTARKGSKTGLAASCARPALRRLERDRARDGGAVALREGRIRCHCSARATGGFSRELVLQPQPPPLSQGCYARTRGIR